MTASAATTSTHPDLRTTPPRAAGPTPRAAGPTPRRAVRSRAGRLTDDDVDEFFAPQRSATSELPDPEPLLRNLTHCAIEALAGARELEQLARWVTDDVYRRLQKRVILAARSRRARGVTAQRPVFTVGRIHRCEPADGIIEAVLIVQQRHRFRSVAIRLEGFDTRWRASVITVL